MGFFVTQISQMTQIFIHRMTRNLFGGFLLRRLLTDFRGGDLFGRCRYPPEVVKSPTDFTDIHRFFLGRFLSHADFADDADFFSSDDTEFIRRFLAEAITHGFSRRRPVRSLQIPPEIGQRDSIKKSVYICEICGTKKLPRKKSASSAKSA